MDMGDLALLAAVGFAAFLFLIAFVCDRNKGAAWLASPWVYTLSISVYCTSWTFYGAVGSAARNGLEYLTIYLGPTIVFIGFWTVLRKILRICRSNSLTSIADFVSSRYGKSDSIAAVVTIIAVVAAAPYIALQIKAITTSFQVIGAASAQDFTGTAAGQLDYIIAFWITMGLGLFTILFGTRTIDSNERHLGVVAAIAVEALVKLIALIGVGWLAVFHVADGPAEVLERIAASTPHTTDGFGIRWVGIIILSGAAVICLPRQFQVTIVENQRESHLFTASWLFPLYLFLMSLFVLPIAIVGQTFLPEGANPDMFVLTVPLASDRPDIALLAFLGGFSSGTSMVIISCIALSTMISNHIAMPLALRSSYVKLEGGGDVRRFLLVSRRIAICVILFLGFIYLRTGSSEAGLASIGLIAFAGAAQVMPALLGGMYWEGANGRGALCGLIAGGTIWAYTLLLPGLLDTTTWWQTVSAEGLFGLSALRPGALFGLGGQDPLMHALFWSLLLNTLGFIAGSLTRLPSPIEQLQSSVFVNVFGHQEPSRPVGGRTASIDKLFNLAQRVMGPDRAYGIFRTYALDSNAAGEFPEVDNAFINHLEKRMAASVGASSARAMISTVTGSETISLDELVRIADETAKLMRYSSEVTRKSDQIEEAARQLGAANERLRALDRQKDDFLSQVSHELRTPMTSIRSFTEILSGTPDLDPAERERFIRIIHTESIRLTSLLDEILDMNVIERGDNGRALTLIDPEVALDQAIDACLGLSQTADVRITQDRASASHVMGDTARLTQVFINIISNAIKYNTNPSPQISITSTAKDGFYTVVIADNGAGIPDVEGTAIFEKFSRGSSAQDHAGAGLGLAISHAIIARFNGTLHLLPDAGTGAAFEIRIPING